MLKSHILKKVGLSKNDQRVYLPLLEMGSAPCGEIIKITGLHRSYVYDILKKLIKLRLVSFIVKDKIKIFIAEDPKVILGLLEEQKKDIENHKKEFEAVLPYLVKKQKAVYKKQLAKVLIGKEGIKTIFDDILTEKENFVFFGSFGKLRNLLKWDFENWQKRRVELGICCKLLFNGKFRDRKIKEKIELSNVKFMPEEYEIKITTFIYGEKVAIIEWDDEPTVLVLEGKRIKESYMNNFKMLWEIGASSI